MYLMGGRELAHLRLRKQPAASYQHNQKPTLLQGGG